MPRKIKTPSPEPIPDPAAPQRHQHGPRNPARLPVTGEECLRIALGARRSMPLDELCRQAAQRISQLSSGRLDTFTLFRYVDRRRLP